ncbi:MAG: diguanylate cyclase [Candidatus Krumholzibacteria bacterium]|nr:diguanylate cyclase [Candidatus Krumholzibacteria bacterium]
MKNQSGHTAIRILVVDDDPSILDSLNATVTSLGYDCTKATNGLEAIDRLKAQKIDVVITSVSMPKLDGLQLLSYIKIHQVETDVIIVTSLADKLDYAGLIEAGASDYMRKPYGRRELEAKLVRVERERTLIRELEDLTLHDSLTGLLNRRSFDAKLMAEVQRAHRQEYDVSLALIDIDNFKFYNDTFGHLSGDKVLIAMGIILRTCTRKNVDFTFRFGGDEFAVILTQASKTQALSIMTRILETYRRAGFEGTGLSVGLVYCKPDEDLSWQGNVSHMIEVADQTLYAAKFNGKNKVVLGL